MTVIIGPAHIGAYGTHTHWVISTFLIIFYFSGNLHSKEAEKKKDERLQPKKDSKATTYKAIQRGKMSIHE